MLAPLLFFKYFGSLYTYGRYNQHYKLKVLLFFFNYIMMKTADIYVSINTYGYLLPHNNIDLKNDK